MRPVEFASDGIFLCGLAHYPKSIDESIAQSMAAASRAATVLAKPTIKISPLVSQIDTEKCIGCGLCSEVCPFGAIAMDEVEGKGYRARNISASCKGCGLCASTCPQKAIDMLHFRDEKILATVKAVVAREMAWKRPDLICRGHFFGSGIVELRAMKVLQDELDNPSQRTL